MLETPVLEIVIALVGIQLVALLYLYYRADGESSATATTAEPTDDPANPPDGVVECGDCGAKNDPSYRYCRRCVADLAGDGVPGSRDRSPQGRLF
ncbi:DUF7577 domain-containing protein [Halalkalicoccus ordinarius]|uniref:DUF7577 domain-containing protein n=1 Tax=Halalkalicoccus ordinarius TaxID=3116651 RepID=UPI00300F41BA